MKEITLTSEITVREMKVAGTDRDFVEALKVSSAGDDCIDAVEHMAEEEIIGKIGFAMKHRHGSVFEHGMIRCFVHAPIFVWREHHRHRIGWSYNEESGRYKPLDPIFWIPRRDRRMIPVEGWKPGRPKFLTLEEGLNRPDLPEEMRSTMADRWYNAEISRDRESYEVAYRNYIASMEDGFAFEVARSKLPVAIYSSCWTTSNPRSMMAFLSLRKHDPGAKFVSYPQAEIQEVADQYEAIFAKYWPITHKAFVENGRVGP